MSVLISRVVTTSNNRTTLSPYYYINTWFWAKVFIVLLSECNTKTNCLFNLILSLFVFFFILNVKMCSTTSSDYSARCESRTKSHVSLFLLHKMYIFKSTKSIQKHYQTPVSNQTRRSRCENWKKNKKKASSVSHRFFTHWELLRWEPMMKRQKLDSVSCPENSDGLCSCSCSHGTQFGWW